MTTAAGAACERRHLRKLARANGVQTGFRGTDGTRHAASDEALIGVLKALGVKIERPTEAPELLRETVDARARRLVEPVVALRQGEPLRLELRLPSSVDPHDVWVGLPSDADHLSFDRATQFAATRADETRWTLDLGSSVLGLGYHQLVVEAPTASANVTAICAPRQCPSPRRCWGTSIPLYALRSSSDWGVGSFSDLARLVRWTADLGAGFFATLPICAVFDDVGFADPSPYMPVSRLAWNDVYVDIEHIAELSSSPEARAVLESSSFRDRIRELRERRSADPKAVVRVKRKLLGTLATSLLSRNSERRHEFERYVSSHPEIVRYAAFRAACHKTQSPFRDWGDAEALRRRQTPSLDTLSQDMVALGHLYGQWICEEQLAMVRESGVGLHLDIPVGVHPSGFDLWSQEDSFAVGASGGAPPDDFFAGGQLWGFTPLHPERIRESGYGYFSSSLRNSMRVASSVRIDHVMGLHRLYWVPDGSEPTDGAYVRYRADELHAVVSLEAHLAGTAVVGEDLGTVPGSVRRAMEKDRMLRSFVFEFSSDEEDPLPESPEWSIASLATHDLPPFASYWRGGDVEERRARDQIDEKAADREASGRARWRSAVVDALASSSSDSGGSVGLLASGRGDALDDASVRDVLAGCLVYLASGPARLVSVDLEDLLIETEPQNRPGTGAEEGNFSRRARRSIEEMESDRNVVEILEKVARARLGDSPGTVAAAPASRPCARPVPMGG